MISVQEPTLGTWVAPSLESLKFIREADVRAGRGKLLVLGLSHCIPWHNGNCPPRATSGKPAPADRLL